MPWSRFDRNHAAPTEGRELSYCAAIREAIDQAMVLDGQESGGQRPEAPAGQPNQPHKQQHADGHPPYHPPDDEGIGPGRVVKSGVEPAEEHKLPQPAFRGRP